MSERMSLGINLSILLISAIFAALLSVPLRLLLDTNYYAENETLEGNETSAKETAVALPIDHKKLKVCPKPEYSYRVKSIFFTDYDGNCTYPRPRVRKVQLIVDVLHKEFPDDEIPQGGLTPGNPEEGKQDPQGDRTKSFSLVGHVLVAMLVVSAVAALVEVLRIRFCLCKVGSTSRSLKKGSFDEPGLSQFVSKPSIQSQTSFEMQGSIRSGLRLLGEETRRSWLEGQDQRHSSAGPHFRYNGSTKRLLFLSPSRRVGDPYVRQQRKRRSTLL
ncbi:uncharacterized protein LOC105700652 [Orussus abietinus]|uniref:uncharacterized protein LOC105700652 n=1 Tax=Orussus abietinus TaxID=222816 RepID=UPI000625A385|nr:uncharacterized protein LOC105700652 [Orussus abietinus]